MPTKYYLAAGGRQKIVNGGFEFLFVSCETVAGVHYSTYATDSEKEQAVLDSKQIPAIWEVAVGEYNRRRGIAEARAPATIISSDSSPTFSAKAPALPDRILDTVDRTKVETASEPEPAGPVIDAEPVKSISDAVRTGKVDVLTPSEPRRGKAR